MYIYTNMDVVYDMIYIYRHTYIEGFLRSNKSLDTT